MVKAITGTVSVSLMFVRIGFCLTVYLLVHWVRRSITSKNYIFILKFQLCCSVMEIKKSKVLKVNGEVLLKRFLYCNVSLIKV